MSIRTRFLSALMAFCMIFGVIAGLSLIPVFAADDAETEGEDKEIIDYLNDAFESKEDKLASMQLMFKKYDYELYYEAYTGEVGVKNVKTGDILLTNPYDLGDKNAASTENLKKQLLPQILIKYQTNDGKEQTLNSFVEAAQRGQIKVKRTKNGIRVEYVMGKQESRVLLPMCIEQTRMEEVIFAKMDEKSRIRFQTFYALMDPNDPDNTEEMKNDILTKYPITQKYAIYVWDPSATEKEIVKMEALLRQSCPEYSFEALEYDHNLVEYESVNKNPVQFRLALEYYIDESGLSVRLPANGIRFDQSTYQLSYIRLLPYMGAGSSEYTGYTMIPDGSGTLVRFEDIVESGIPRVITGALYGSDYAYHTINGQVQEVMRLPIFGVIEDGEYEIKVEVPADSTEDTTVGSDEVTGDTEPNIDDSTENSDTTTDAATSADTTTAENTDTATGTDSADGSDTATGTDGETTEKK